MSLMWAATQFNALFMILGWGLGGGCEVNGDDFNNTKVAKTIVFMCVWRCWWTGAGSMLMLIADHTKCDRDIRAPRWQGGRDGSVVPACIQCMQLCGIDTSALQA